MPPPTRGFSVTDTLNMMSSQATPRCKKYFGYLESSEPSTKTIVCTIAILVLTVCLECVVSANLDYCDANEPAESEDADATESTSIPLLETVSEQPQLQPQPEPEIQATLQPTPETAEQKSDAGNTPVAPPSADCCAAMCMANPSPLVRSNRLAFGSFIFAGILTAFILRMKEATTHVHLPIECSRTINQNPPNWTAIVLLNIIPFTSASLAWLRAVVDCILVRWGKSLNYDTDIGPVWSPCMPFLIVGVAAYLAVECVKIPIGGLMGRWEISLWTAKTGKKGKESGNDVEMQGEEAQGLVGNADGEWDRGEEGGEEPPAYDKVVSPRGSIDGIKKADSVV